MLNIQIIGVGKIKEEYLRNATGEYAKRLSKYCNLTITEIVDEKLPNKLNDKIKEEVKQKECMRILEHIKKDSFIICLDLTGKQYSSEDFSKQLGQIALNYNSHITFIIGGTLGLTNQILSLAKEKICFSRMTFPHQLIRVFLLEQLFRAFKIQKGETYHW